MRRIAIHDADGGKYPNLALMKLAAWHRARGDTVERFMPLYTYDHIYSSKVFSYTPESPYLPANTEKGGTGYGNFKDLPDSIEHICPDYEFFGVNYSLGFLTRGCIRSCPWCVVPRKEGAIRAHADIGEFARHRDVKLMDNNFLALPEYAVEQLAKIRRADLRIDFNQGLDARLIDAAMASHLAKARWIRFLRMSCDHRSQMVDIEKAIRLLRAAGGGYREYWCYVLVNDDVEDAHERVMFLKSLKVKPFAQPYRDSKGTEPTYKQRIFARWCDRPEIRETTAWPIFWEQHRSRQGTHWLVFMKPNAAVMAGGLRDSLP
jgi:hypothetical protein